MLKAFVLCMVAASMTLLKAAEEPIVLWPGGAPGAKGTAPADVPTLTPYLPEKSKANGAAVVVCPGGAYRMHAVDHEGVQVARFLNQHGIAAFVLKYRLGPTYNHPAPLNDAQRAVRHVRANAKELGIATNRVGIMGFSAGGHLASTLATHFDAAEENAKDEVGKQSSRPDFAILGYPVVSMYEPNVHAFSRKMLLGDNPDPKLVELLSNEKQVTSNTPPTFLMHTTEDNGVLPDNSILFYQALRTAGVPVELHIFAFGPHGIGLAPADPAAGKWPELLINWMRKSGFLTDKPRASVSGSVQVNGKPMERGWVRLTPESGDQEPVAAAFLSGGKFHLRGEHSPVIGTHKVEVVQVAESTTDRPSMEDLIVLPAGTFNVKQGTNTLTLNLSSK
ncbi:MAG TPA: alpha/beta hydrolase [Methylomirabilota bacterium]|nr:alpha/beta hydrolase [Methylomirabilota bacterium]